MSANTFLNSISGMMDEKFSALYGSMAGMLNDRFTEFKSQFLSDFSIRLSAVEEKISVLDKRVIQLEKLNPQFQIIESQTFDLKNTVNKLKEKLTMSENEIFGSQKMMLKLDEEMRDKNLIIYGVEEGDDTNLDDKVKHILSATGVSIDNFDVKRLGKITEDNKDKIRPLFLGVESRSQKFDILSGASKLRDEGSPYKKVYINKDCHSFIRKEEGRLRNLAKDLEANKSNPTDVIVFDHKDRCVKKNNVIIEKFSFSNFL